MKIYYSKFVGVGYLIFAAGVSFQFFFSPAHGLIDFSQLNLPTVISTILFFRCYLCNDCRHQKTD